VALRMGRGVMMGGGALLLLAAVLGWAWYDGGMRPQHLIETPAMLPRIAA